MNRFTDHLSKISKDQNKSKRTLNVFKRISNIMNDDKKDYNDFEFLCRDRERIRSWLLNNLSLSSVVSYSIALRHAVESMDLPESEKQETVRFYLQIASETQRLQNSMTGRVAKEFKSKRPIAEIEEMIQKKPRVDNTTRPLPVWKDTGASLDEQIKEFVETLKTPKGTFLRPTSKQNYKSNIKTVMNRMHQKDLDFLLNVPLVTKFLNETDNSKEGAQKYLSRQSSRAYQTSIVTFLPLAKTDHPTLRMTCKQQYNAWLMDHPSLETPCRIKDYKEDWIQCVKKMQKQINTSKDELHRLLLSLYTDSPPRRSLDYAHMLINVPDNRVDNVLIFTPSEKKFIFNTYKNSNCKGPQEISIVSPSLIKILQLHLIKNSDQQYLLMRNDKALDDSQIRDILRTELGSGIQKLRRLFATFLVCESNRNPREFKEYARKMGTSVNLLMSNYCQVAESDDEEYQGVGDLFCDAKN